MLYSIWPAMSLETCYKGNPDEIIIERLTSFIDANYSCQTLVAAKSRGGLTAVNEEAPGADPEKKLTVDNLKF